MQSQIDQSKGDPGKETSSSKRRPSRRQSRHESSYLQSSLMFAKGNRGHDDSGSDSDPENPIAPIQVAADNQQKPTKEQDRESLLKELERSTWATLEEFKAANGEKIKRCYMADERDQNRTILHWLSIHLLPNSITKENLHWLVYTVVELDTKIVTRITADTQKATCLHIAIQYRRFDLIDYIFQTSDVDALQEAISHGDYCNETCLHLAVRLNPPSVGVIKQILEKADHKAITKQRSCRYQDDKSSDGNTVLHDFVHINLCFETGYIKTLKRFIQRCPEALKMSNTAKESPFQFHLSTRQKRNPDWKGLEFSPIDKKVSREDKTVAKVGQILLSEAFSEPTWEGACSCLYGEKNFDLATTFQPAAPINKRIDKSHPFLHFYPILSYVELVLAHPEPPDIKHDAVVQHSNEHEDDLISTEWASRADSIRRVFAWFRRQKVRRILKLVVIDDSSSPCSDAIMEECLRDFDVRYLNWTKDDICVEVLRNSGLSNVKELWLTWSGRNSVLYSWSCKDNGFPTLPKLQTVHIHTRAGIESTEANKKNLAGFNSRLQDSIAMIQIEEYRADLTTRVTKELEPELASLGSKLQPAMSKWTDGPDYVQLARVGEGEESPMIQGTIAGLEARMMFDLKETKSLREIKVDDTSHDSVNEGKASKYKRRQAQKGHRWLDAARRLATAVNTHRLNSQLPVQPIKVALLDDGVTPGELSVPGVLKGGWPLPSTNGLYSSKPYYNSETGHGTKMARLIYFMCPFVSIYVAKIDMHREQDASVAVSAAKAIEWAISKKVDIISMSWTIKEVKSGQGANQKAISALERAIQLAANEDILMFCAVQDSAHYGNEEPFPQKSDTKKLMIVGSADEDGDRSKFVNENSFDYLFPGEIGIPGMLTEKDKGSSVATAVAAGMAAMVLWCAEYHSLAIKSEDAKDQESLSNAKAPVTTLSSSLIITEESKMGQRTAPEWDFRRDRRMSALFDVLKPDKDKFVDITGIINRAMASIDEFHEADREIQKSCIESFISTCKDSLPLNLR